MAIPYAHGMEVNPTALEAPHPKPTLLSDFILGGQDGIVNVLGIILGLVAAESSLKVILIATLAAMGAESVAMAAVAYTSTKSRRRLYLSEAERERQEMKHVPAAEREEVRTVLMEWGYQGKELEQMLDLICHNPKAWLEFMMAFELKLAPIEESAPRTSGYIVGGATIVGHLVPLLPFLFVGADIFLGAVMATIFSGIALFGIGWYEAKITGGKFLSNGLQMVLIGLGGGLAGFVIGHLINATPWI